MEIRIELFTILVLFFGITLGALIISLGWLVDRGNTIENLKRK